MGSMVDLGDVAWGPNALRKSVLVTRRSDAMSVASSTDSVSHLLRAAELGSRRSVKALGAVRRRHGRCTVVMHTCADASMMMHMCPCYACALVACLLQISRLAEQESERQLRIAEKETARQIHDAAYEALQAEEAARRADKADRAAELRKQRAGGLADELAHSVVYATGTLWVHATSVLAPHLQMRRQEWRSASKQLQPRKSRLRMRVR
jgi:hypothetical protein